MKNTHEKQEEQYVLFDTEAEEVLMIGSKSRCLRAFKDYYKHFEVRTATQVALAKIVPFRYNERGEILES